MRNFIEGLSEQNKEKKIFDRVYFAKGVPSQSAMTSFMAAYYREPSQIYEDVVSTAESTYGNKAVTNLAPYKSNLLLKELSRLEIATSRLQQIMLHYGIDYNRKHSISAVAKKEGDFAHAFEMISSSIVSPALRTLNDMQSLVKSMETGISQSPLKL